MAKREISNRRALQLIREAVGPGGRVVFSRHADGALDDDECDRNDALNAIRKGRIAAREPDSPEVDRITIEGPKVDGGFLHLVIVIEGESPSAIRVITAFDPDRRSPDWGGTTRDPRLRR